MLHLLKSEVFIRGGGGWGGGGLGPLFLNFLDPPLDCMDHLSETGDKQLLLSYLNLKSLIKISLKEEFEFVHTKFTYFCGGSSRTG